MGEVLTSVYRTTPQKLIAACKALVDLPNIECEQEDRLRRALDAVGSGVDWADALLWAATLTSATLLTDDKAFAKRAVVLGWNVECRLRRVEK